MPTAQTLKILEDLKKAGLDTSTIENQLRVDPIKEKQADSILGGGILRLADYTRFAQEYNTKNAQLQSQLSELATRQGAIGLLTKDSEAYKEMAEHIETLERALVEADHFTEESVKNVHAMSQERLAKLITDSTTNPPNPNLDLNKAKEGDDMPANFDPTKFVDVDSFKISQANLAMGSVLTNMEVNARIRELDDLGIKYTPQQLRELQVSLHKQLSGSGSVEGAFEETFKLSEVRTTKQAEEIKRQVDEARAAGYAEAKKEDGVPARKTNLLGGRHVILDSKTIGKSSNETVQADSIRDDKGQIDPTKLPRNKDGEVERYKLRGSREARLARAGALMDQVQEHYANDPTYVE